MARYRVVRNCYGFQKRYWEKGQIVDLDPHANPPRHFELISDSVEHEPAPAAPKIQEPQAPLAPQTLASAAAGIPAPERPRVQLPEGRAAGKASANRNGSGKKK